ncbi:MAG: hypothetical protein V3V22_00880, partial [Methylococcales bacterium]
FLYKYGFAQVGFDSLLRPCSSESHRLRLSRQYLRLTQPTTLLCLFAHLRCCDNSYIAHYVPVVAL